MKKTESNKMAILKLLSNSAPMSTGHIGNAIWADTSIARRKPQCYARPAGKLLNAMEREGLVICSLDLNFVHPRWKLTLSGRRRANLTNAVNETKHGKHKKD